MKKNAPPITCATCPHLTTSSFCSLHTAEVQRLDQYKSVLQLKRHKTLFYENDQVKGLHCVRQGRIKLFKTLNDGSVQILKIAKESELIGYRGLLGNGKYIASAEVIEDAIVCFIPKEKIFELIHQNLSFSLGLMSKIAGDISEAELRSVNFLQKSSRERLAEALLLLEKSFGTSPDGFIDLKLTREEIAGYTGMAVETTIRLLYAMVEEGLIELYKKRIKILDRTKLLDISRVEE